MTGYLAKFSLIEQPITGQDLDRVDKRDTFLKKLSCCVCGKYYKIIWFYQLGLKCELSSVRRFRG